MSVSNNCSGRGSPCQPETTDEPRTTADHNTGTIIDRPPSPQIPVAVVAEEESRVFSGDPGAAPADEQPEAAAVVSAAEPPDVPLPSPDIPASAVTPNDPLPPSTTNVGNNLPVQTYPPQLQPTAAGPSTAPSAAVSTPTVGPHRQRQGAADASRDGSSATITAPPTAAPASVMAAPQAAPTTPSRFGKVEVKLFIGRLPRTIDESELTPMFTPFGQVVETVIIRDKVTGMHKGSAFVKMASLTEADAAVRALHNIKVVDPQLGPIQVKYANGEAERLGLSTESAQAGSDLGKLFVGSLPRSVTEQEVRQVFEPYGRIDEVVLMKDASTGQPKGCAFVKFAYKEMAIHAIKALHGQFTFPGCPRPLEVKFAESRRAAVAAAQQPPQPLVGYIPTAAAAGMPLRGPPGLPTQPSNLNPRSAGGWTEYFTADGRAYYYHELTKTTQWTKPLEFDRLLMVPTATPPAATAAYMGPALGSDVAGPPGANVFVFHIPNEWTQNELLTHFSQFGRIISCYVATDRATGRNKGYGFVSYDNIQSAANAVLGMNGCPVGGKRLKVSIKTGEETYVAHLLGPAAAAAAAHLGSIGALATAAPVPPGAAGSYGPVGMSPPGATAMGAYRSVPY